MVGSKEFSLFSCCSLCLWQTLCTWASEVRFSQYPFLCYLWMTASLYLAPLVDQWIMNPSLLLPSWWDLSSISAGLRQYIFYPYSNNVPNFAWIQVWAGFLPIPCLWQLLCPMTEVLGHWWILCLSLRGRVGHHLHACTTDKLPLVSCPTHSFSWVLSWSPMVKSGKYW